MKTVELLISTHVSKVREVEPVLRAEKEGDKTVVVLGEKQYEVVIGPPISLAFVMHSSHDIKPGQVARIKLEVDVP
jgi:hypothetical protein